MRYQSPFVPQGIILLWAPTEQMQRREESLVKSFPHMQVQTCQTEAQLTKTLQEHRVELLVAPLTYDDNHCSDILRDTDEQYLPAKAVIITRLLMPGESGPWLDLGSTLFLDREAPSELLPQAIQSLYRERLAYATMLGRLDEVFLGDVMQLVAHGKKSCVIAVEGKHLRGELWFRKGILRRASLQRAALLRESKQLTGIMRTVCTGEAACLEMMRCQKGFFSVSSVGDEELSNFEYNIGKSWDYLMFESARLHDEQHEQFLQTDMYSIELKGFSDTFTAFEEEPPTGGLSVLSSE